MKSAEISLSFVQRVLINGIIPHQGGLTEMILNKSLRKKIAMTPEEIDEFQVKDIVTDQGHQSVSWNPNKVEGKMFGIDLNDSEKKQLRQIFQAVIAKKALSEKLVDLAIYLNCSDDDNEN